MNHPPEPVPTYRKFKCPTCGGREFYDEPERQVSCFHCGEYLRIYA